MSGLLDGVFKFNPNDPDSMIGRVLKSATSNTNAGKMSARVVISTQDEDYSNDVIVTRGIRTHYHEKNPIALFAHKSEAPIGKFLTPMGDYTVRMRGDTQLVGEVYFNQSSQLAHDVFRCVEEKAFSAVSIGAKPVAGTVEKRPNGGNIYHEMVLVEASILPIGDNPNAIVEIVEKGFGGKRICDPLMSILRPYVSERPVMVQSGWDLFDAPFAGKTINKASTEYPAMDENEDEKRPDDEFQPIPMDQDETPPEADDTPGLFDSEPAEDDGMDDDGGDMGDDADMGDPVAEEDAPMGHEEVTSQSFEQAAHAILSAWAKGEMDGDEAMRRMQIFVDAKAKLEGAGEEEAEFPDVMDQEDVGPDDLVEKEDGEGDEEEMDEEEIEEKAWYNEKDSATIRKAYKLLASIVAAPALSKRKLDAHARHVLKGLGEISPVVQMVKKSQRDKMIEKMLQKMVKTK